MTPYYEQDGIAIYHGDCREILPTLEQVDVVLTDPPYSSGGAMRSDRNQATSAKYQCSTGKQLPEFSGDNKDQRAYTSWVADWLGLCKHNVKSGTQCFVFTDWRQLPATSDAIQWAGWVWRGLVTWHKPSGRRLQNRFASDAEYVVWGSVGPLDFDLNGSAGPSSVISQNAPSGNSRQHIAQKPVELMSHLLAVTAESASVLVPCMGSGSTLVAAKDLGRKAIGIEIEERYCEIAANRLAQGVLFGGAS
ncbi:MAG: DNA methyltransferase [Planctomycetota bacterium]